MTYIYINSLIRHMVASRDIKAGEVIFEEAPLTFGPSENSRPVCLGCYTTLRKLNYFCSKCGFPMCEKRCQEIREHKDFECKVFQEKLYKADKKKFRYLSYYILYELK